MRRLIATVAGVVLLAGTVVFGPGRAGAAGTGGAAVYWNEVALNTIVADSRTATPSAAALYVAMVQAAVYNATMAIEGTHELYRSSLTAPPGASVDAAVADAAYGVLVVEFPAQRAALDAAHAAALAEIPDGQAKTDGIHVGSVAADDLLAQREGDGRFASVPAPPNGGAPGAWQWTGATPVTPWTAHVKPFVVNSPEQFRPGGPNALTSADYAAQWDEVRRFGSLNSTDRSEEQTEIARFWTENTVAQYNRAFRQLAIYRGLSAAETARLFAMTALTGADGMITCWNTKYHYRFWRPITAIRQADTDGNAATTADPTWTPFSVTGNHPEYTSGHACLTGAVSRALATFLGTNAIDLPMDSKAAGTIRHDFATVDELRTEVENARIYGGDHFRVGGSDGTKAGDHVAKWGLKRNFQAA